MRRALPLVVVLAAVAAAAVTAGFGRRAASAHVERPRPAHDIVYSTQVQPSTGSTSEVSFQESSTASSPPPELSVFRRPATEDDQLPDGSLLATMGDGAGGSGSGPDLRLVRKLVAADGFALYTAPSRDRRTICSGLFPGNTADCGSGLLDGLMPQVETSSRRMHGRVYGIAADSVKAVDVLLANGKRLRALLGRNGFYVTLPLRPPPRALVVTARDGTRARLRIAQAP